MQCGTSFLFKKNVCKTPQSQQDLHSSLISENHSLEMSENSNKPKQHLMSSLMFLSMSVGFTSL